MTENYKNPPIPIGYEHVDGCPSDGFIIRRSSDNSELVWVPVLLVDDDSPVQTMSVRRYGGFYISLYTMSKSESGLPQSIRGKTPWTFINRRDAISEAARFEQCGTIFSHLPYTADMDALTAWMMNIGLITPEKVEKATGARGTALPNRKLRLTGVMNGSRLGGLCDFVGNVDEWVRESVDVSLETCCECKYPEATRCYYRPYSCYAFTGFRAVLDIK